MRPPQRSRASTMVTLLPARASSRAVIRPAAPAPTIRKAVKCRGAIVLGDVGLNPALTSGRERHKKIGPGIGARAWVGGKRTSCGSWPGARRASLQRVEPHRAAGQYLVSRLGGQRPESVADHLRRAREEAVLMRIIGRPHDLVRADRSEE